MTRNYTIRNMQGFSFVELMVVIALVGILSAIGLPNFLRSLPEKRLKNAARNMYVDLQKVRLLAVKENRNVTVTFDTTAGKYSFQEGAGITEGVLTDYGEVEYGCSATTVSADPAASPVTGDITFTNLGEIGTATTQAVYLQSPSASGICYAVTVSRFGSVKIFRYNGSAWE